MIILDILSDDFLLYLAKLHNCQECLGHFSSESAAKILTITLARI